MKKKNLFGKFYLEALRQTRVVGIIFTVILSVASLAMILGQYISDLSHGTDIIGYKHGPVTVSFGEINPLHGIITFIMAPLLALMVFSFLNKRASSDFYHSVTQKRGTVYISYSLSCVTWIVFTLIVSTLVGVISASLCNGFYIINWNTFVFLAERMVSSIYVVAATTLAMTLTGTLLNNILVTGMILFVPRIIMGVIALTILNEVSVLPGIEHLGLLDPRYNLVCGDIFYILGEIGSYDKYDFNPLIYTAVIGIVFFILGYIAFRMRPSESAGQSAPSRLLQTIYRISFTMVICSVACILIFRMINRSSFYVDDAIMLVIIYVFALIGWFVYELITTRKLFNLVRSLPSLSIVVILNIAIVLTMSGIKSGVERFRPQPEEIEYVKLVGEDYDFYNNGNLSLYEYLLGDLSEVKLSDEKVNEIVSKYLIETIDRDNDYYADSITSYVINEYRTITVGIKTKSGLKYRCFDVPTSETKKINAALNETVINSDGLNKLPDADDVYAETYHEITDMQFLEVYKVLLDEIAAMDKTKLLEIASDDSDVISYFYVYTPYGFDELGIQIPLSLRYERTVQKYFELIDENNRLKLFLYKDKEELKDLTDTNVNVEIYKNGEISDDWYGSLTQFIESGMFDILAERVDKELDVKEKMAYVNISYYDYELDEYFSFSRYISLSDLEYDDLPLEIRNGESKY